MIFANARGSAVLVCAFSLGALAMAVDATAQSEGGRIDQSAAQVRQQSPVAEERAAALEQALEGLRADLILLAEQVPAWEAYASKVRALDSAHSSEAALEDVSRAARALFDVLVREQRSMASTRVAILSRRLTEGTTGRIRDGAASGIREHVSG